CPSHHNSSAAGANRTRARDYRRWRRLRSGRGGGDGRAWAARHSRAGGAARREINRTKRAGRWDAAACGDSHMTDSIRVLVVDDHLVVRKGIRALLATEPGVEVVGEASDGAEAVFQAARLRPDVILMDLVMPQMGGIAAIRQILAGDQSARIL